MVVVDRVMPDGKKGTVYLDGYIKEILDFYYNAVHFHKTTAVLVFDGRSGMGKTTLSNQFGIYLDKDFSLKKIFFTPQEFLEGLADAKKGDYLCFDEAMMLSSRATMTKINQMIVAAMSMIRSKQIFVAFCINSIFDLDRNLAISRADILCHVYGNNLIDRGKYGAFFRSKEGQDKLKLLYLMGRKFYDYSKPRANFVASFTKNFVVDEKEYEEKKQIGVNSYLEGDNSASTKKKDITIYRLLSTLRTLGYNNTQIAELAALSDRHVGYLLAKHGLEMVVPPPSPVKRSDTEKRRAYLTYKEVVKNNKPEVASNTKKILPTMQ